jgi:tight adherence protein B
LLNKLFKKKNELDRLSQLVGEETTEDEQLNVGQEAIENLDKAVSKSSKGSNIARMVASADLKLRVIEFVAIKIGAAIVGTGLGPLMARRNDEVTGKFTGFDMRVLIAVALVGALIFSFIPDIFVKMRAKKRIKSFNDQLGDTITMMANSLRGGYSFLQTMDLVGKEAPEPTAKEFKRVVQEVGLGRTSAEALDNLLKRMPSDNLDLMITAVNIQHEVGGNLATILDSIGHTIRERVRIKGEINTLTAQGRLSGYVITGLPIAMAGYITLVNPQYMAPIFKFGMPPEAWCCLPVTALFFIVIGYVVMMKIVDIEV